MMLHLGEKNLVPRFEVGASPCLRHEVDPFSRAAGENNLIRVASVDEFGGALPGGLESIRGAIAQLVNASVDVGVIPFVKMAQGIEDGARLLGSSGVIQIDQRMSMHLLIENGKVLPQLCPINGFAWLDWTGCFRN